MKSTHYQYVKVTRRCKYDKLFTNAEQLIYNT